MAHDQPDPRRLRFGLRTVLIGVTLIALAFGWYTSLARERARSALLMQQWRNAQLQVRLQAPARAISPFKDRRGFSRATFEEENLRDVVIEGGESAFQRTIFDKSDLSNASLKGGISSFQGASFNDAILRNAQLTGGGASFQLATFDNADLSGAKSSGNLQGISLQNANCKDITIIGSLQGANIDRSQFRGADLTAISHQDLESCYYEVPPIYDAQTKFPDGFDPAKSGWNFVDSASGPARR